jgi:aspartate beta-hydroxylase
MIVFSLIKAVGKSSVSRIRDWIINKMNGMKRPANCPEMQRGCPEVIPGLRAYPFWDSKNLPWISEV